MAVVSGGCWSVVAGGGAEKPHHPGTHAPANHDQASAPFRGWSFAPPALTIRAAPGIEARHCPVHLCHLPLCLASMSWPSCLHLCLSFLFSLHTVETRVRPALPAHCHVSVFGCHGYLHKSYDGRAPRLQQKQKRSLCSAYRIRMLALVRSEWLIPRISTTHV